MFDKPTRNHITIIFERLGFVFFTLLLFGLNSLQNSVNEIFNPDFWRSLTAEATDLNNVAVVFGGIAFLVFVLVVLLVSLRYWQKTFFYIDGQNFIFERKTLFKKYSKLPIANISTVNVQRSIFERLVGTGKVKLDLNSSHTANRTDFAFVLPVALAEELRNTLANIKAGTQGDGSLVPDITGEPSPCVARREIISFSAAEVLRHKVLSIPIVQGVVAISAVIGASVPNGEAAWNMQSFINLMLFGIAGYAGVMIWGALNLAGYRVESDDKHLYINCGLIKKTSYTFAYEKVNAVFIKQPVLARIFGLYSIEVAVVGLGNEKAETPQLCLLVNKDQMEKVIAQCAADFTCGGMTIPSHKAALIPAAVQTVFFSALTLLLLATSFPYTWLTFAGVFVLSALGGWLSYKTKTIAYDNDVFHYSKGIFAKQKAMFKYGDIQDTRIKTNLLLRGMNVGRLSLNILSGAKMKAHTTGYFKLPDLETVSSRVVEREDSSTGLLG